MEKKRADARTIYVEFRAPSMIGRRRGGDVSRPSGNDSHLRVRIDLGLATLIPFAPAALRPPRRATAQHVMATTMADAASRLPRAPRPRFALLGSSVVDGKLLLD